MNHPLMPGSGEDRRMNGFKKYLAGALFASMIFTNMAHAMPTLQFDALSTNDQNNYVTALSMGTAKALYIQGDIKGGDKLVQLLKDGSKTGGEAQFFKYLNEIRVINLENSKDPKNTKRYDVEYAMALLLKNNGIAPLPMSTLMSINKDFKPSISQKH